MKIAIIYSWDGQSGVGGVQNYVRFMVDNLTRGGHEVRVFLPRFGSDEPPPETARGIAGYLPVNIDLGRRPFVVPKRLHRLGRLVALGATFLNRLGFNMRAHRTVEVIRDWGPDVVWQQDLSGSFRAAKALSRGCAVVLTNHTGEYLLLDRFPPTRWVVRRLLRGYDAVMGPSAELTPPIPRATFIPNGADPLLCAPVSAEERRKLRNALLPDGSASTFVILCPRRWAPSKGILTLARALGRLNGRASRPDWLVIFAGDAETEYPDYVQQVEDELKQAAVPWIRVGSLSLEALVDYYRAADLTVIPSVLEATSLAAVESMLVGTPVLATAVGGMPTLLTDGRTGYLVAPQAPDAMAERLIEIASDAESRVKVSALGREHALNHYTWPALAARTEMVLVAAVEHANRRRHLG